MMSRHKFYNLKQFFLWSADDWTFFFNMEDLLFSQLRPTMSQEQKDFVDFMNTKKSKLALKTIMSQYRNVPMTDVLVESFDFLERGEHIMEISKNDQKSFFEIMTTMWCISVLDKYSKIYTALLNEDYNPIHNYDGKETRTTTRTPDLSHATQYGATTTTATLGSSTDTVQYNSAEKNITMQNTTQNSTTFRDNERNVESSYTDTTTNTNGARTNTNATGVHTDTLRETGTETTTETMEKGGNLGVTTTQSMIESEITMRNVYNLYEMIASDFVTNKCFPYPMYRGCHESLLNSKFIYD